MVTQPLYSLEYDLGLVEKQVRMLRALVGVSPAVQHASPEKNGPEVEFVAVPRKSLNELVEALEMRIGVLRLALERFKN